MRHGAAVTQFERAFAAYVHAEHGIALSNGTVTLEVALRALGVPRGTRIATTPLTMAATSIAILNAGGVPVYRDVRPDTWTLAHDGVDGPDGAVACVVPVSLYGLHYQPTASAGAPLIDDAAQTVRPHAGCAFTSYSFQRSKIVQTGEGGMLVTNDAHLAQEAREIASLGYRLEHGQSRIDSATLKSPTVNRHYRAESLNARMNDVTADLGLAQLSVLNTRGVRGVDLARLRRIDCARMYQAAVTRCAWLTPQHIPDGWPHDMWTYAVACDTPARARWLSDRMVALGAERPYACWKLTYHERAFRHLAPDGTCPVAEDVQPRLLQYQTNDVASAARNAAALRQAVAEAALRQAVAEAALRQAVAEAST